MRSRSFDPCRVMGNSSPLERGEYREANMTAVSFPEATFGLGLGAFGSDFADCRDRFGEFLAVAGAAGYLPTDGASAPDYLLSAGSFVPEVRVLYGIRCEGQFAQLARFEAAKENRAFRSAKSSTRALRLPARTLPRS